MVNKEKIYLKNQEKDKAIKYFKQMKEEIYKELFSYVSTLDPIDVIRIYSLSNIISQSNGKRYVFRDRPEDRTPSANFYMSQSSYGGRSGIWMFKDFGTGETKNLFSYIKSKTGLATAYENLFYISEIYNDGYMQNQLKKIYNIENYILKVLFKKKNNFVPREIFKKDIDLSELNENNIEAFLIDEVGYIDTNPFAQIIEEKKIENNNFDIDKNKYLVFLEKEVDVLKKKRIKTIKRDMAKIIKEDAEYSEMKPKHKIRNITNFLDLWENEEHRKAFQFLVDRGHIKIDSKFLDSNGKVKFSKYIKHKRYEYLKDGMFFISYEKIKNENNKETIRNSGVGNFYFNANTSKFIEDFYNLINNFYAYYRRKNLNELPIEEKIKSINDFVTVFYQKDKRNFLQGVYLFLKMKKEKRQTIMEVKSLEEKDIENIKKETLKFLLDYEKIIVEEMDKVATGSKNIEISEEKKEKGELTFIENMIILNIFPYNFLSQKNNIDLVHTKKRVEEFIIDTVSNYETFSNIFFPSSEEKREYEIDWHKKTIKIKNLKDENRIIVIENFDDVNRICYEMDKIKKTKKEIVDQQFIMRILKILNVGADIHLSKPIVIKKNDKKDELKLKAFTINSKGSFLFYSGKKNLFPENFLIFESKMDADAMIRSGIYDREKDAILIVNGTSCINMAINEFINFIRKTSRKIVRDFLKKNIEPKKAMEYTAKEINKFVENLNIVIFPQRDSNEKRGKKGVFYLPYAEITFPEEFKEKYKNKVITLNEETMKKLEKNETVSVENYFVLYSVDFLKENMEENPNKDFFVKVKKNGEDKYQKVTKKNINTFSDFAEEKKLFLTPSERMSLEFANAIINIYKEKIQKGRGALNIKNITMDNIKLFDIYSFLKDISEKFQIKDTQEIKDYSDIIKRVPTTDIFKQKEDSEKYLIDTKDYIEKIEKEYLKYKEADNQFIKKIENQKKKELIKMNA